MPSRSKISRLRCRAFQPGAEMQGDFVKPEFPTKSGQTPQVASDTTVFVGAYRSPRGTQQGPKTKRRFRRVYCQYTKTGMPHDAPDRRHRRDKQALSSSTSSGRGESEEGSKSDCGCHAAGLARFRFPPPDSGVVPFSEKPSSPIKSDFGLSGRVGLPFEITVVISIVPSTHPYGCNLGEKRNPSRPCLRD